MSVENINNKGDEFYLLRPDDRNVLEELDPLSKGSFKSDEKGAINAESIAVKVSQKNTSENSDSHGENSRVASAQKQLKKGARVIKFFGSLANGVFGSSKKQEEELRRLEQEVKSLNEQTHSLTSDIKDNMYDSIAIQSGTTNIHSSQSNIDSDVSRSNHASRENNQIDDRSKLNMKKAQKSDRMSELRKKGVK